MVGEIDSPELAKVHSSRPYLIVLLIAVVLSLGLRLRIIEHVLHVHGSRHWLLMLTQRSLVLLFLVLFLAFLGLVLLHVVPGWWKGTALTWRQFGLMVQLASGMAGANLLSENLAIYRVNLSSYKLLMDSLMLYVSICLIFMVWYWFIDHPLRRRRLLWQQHHLESVGSSSPFGIIFPEETLKHDVSQSDRWQPGFVDYAYFAITSSNCFGPPEGHMLVGRPIKQLHIVHSFAMMIVFIVILARAINTLS